MGPFVGMAAMGCDGVYGGLRVRGVRGVRGVRWLGPRMGEVCVCGRERERDRRGDRRDGEGGVW